LRARGAAAARGAPPARGHRGAGEPAPRRRADHARDGAAGLRRRARLEHARRGGRRARHAGVGRPGPPPRGHAGRAARPGRAGEGRRGLPRRAHRAPHGADRRRGAPGAGAALVGPVPRAVAVRAGAGLAWRAVGSALLATARYARRYGSRAERGRGPGRGREPGRERGRRARAARVRGRTERRDPRRARARGGAVVNALWGAYRVLAPVLGAMAPAAGVFTSPAERVLWRERMGRVVRPGGCDAWVHAASLGEAGAAGPPGRELARPQPVARL